MTFHYFHENETLANVTRFHRDVDFSCLIDTQCLA